jgi:transposase
MSINYSEKIEELLARVMVVALARKLLIALWRFATQGVVPEGAAMKPAS